MITDRRKFLAGLLATGLVPKPTWADAGSPEFLSAAALTDGTFVLCGIDANLNVTFTLPLPGRGHAAAAHPKRPEAVAFARRPGTFAVVIDCTTGVQKAVLHAPKGRHFYGHGCFSADKSTLFTTENHYDEARGVIGIRDANTFEVIGEYDTYGVGPHDIHLMPGGKTLVVANGGIETHPDYGRRKLNIDTMQPSLVYIDIASGKKVDEFRLSDPKLSIRHLVVSKQGDVGIATQYQGDTYRQQPTTLVAWQSSGQALQEVPIPQTLAQSIRGYMADIAFDEKNQVLAVTAPRGNLLTLWDIKSSKLLREIKLPEASGVQYLAPQERFIVSSAKGDLFSVKLSDSQATVETLFTDKNTAWDNHLMIA